MNYQEYENKINEEKKRHDDAIKQIHLEYLEEHNKFEVGDIIQDHDKQGKILSWSLFSYDGGVLLKYRCQNLTKKLIPQGKLCYIYAPDIKWSQKNPGKNLGHSLGQNPGKNLRQNLEQNQ